MNLLIYDPSLEPDVGYHGRIVQICHDITDTAVRIATGILQLTWHAHQLQPDVIVFDRVSDRRQLKHLVRILHRINPDMGMFHLDGDGVIAGARPGGSQPELVVPPWLHRVAPDWMLARNSPVPAPLP